MQWWLVVSRLLAISILLLMIAGWTVKEPQKTSSKEIYNVFHQEYQTSLNT